MFLRLRIKGLKVNSKERSLKFLSGSLQKFELNVLNRRISYPPGFRAPMASFYHQHCLGHSSGVVRPFYWTPDDSQMVR